MKKYIKDFCVRGMAYAWGGPVIMVIVWMCLKLAGDITMLTVEQVFLGTISTTVMAFVAAGISVVYEIDNLPIAFAALIQCAVLYADYLGIYLLNGWLAAERVWIFSLIFIAGFIAVWFGIYIPNRIKVNKLNKTIEKAAK